MPNPNFRADQTWLQPGQCTTLRWDVDGIQAVYFFDGFSEIGVAGHDTRQVCPAQATTFQLRIVAQDGNLEKYELTISVGEPPASINFSADHPSVPTGQCTTLRWDVRSVNAVYLNTGGGDEGVGGQGERQVCPGITWTYVIPIVHRNGTQEVRTLTVNVGSVAPQA